jgi:LEA14-like dessication related protein
MRLIGLAMAVLLAGCASYTPLDVFVTGVAPLEGAPLEQRIRIDLRILNPNDQALAAHGMRIQLDVNGQRLARGVSDAAFTVPRLGEITTSIVASTSLFDLARQVVVLSARQSMDYALSGELFLDGMGRSVKFHQAGRFGVVNPTAAPALK